MRIRALLGSMIAVGLVVVTAPVAGASAPPPRPTEGDRHHLTHDAITPMVWGFVRNKATGRCLEERPGRIIGTAPCRFDNDQTWEWRPGTGGQITWILVNRSTGNCLDANFNLAVYAHPCNGGNFQNWRRAIDGNYTIIQHVPTNGVLDSNFQGQVYLHAFNDGDFQKWY